MTLAGNLGPAGSIAIRIFDPYIYV
jgi:hypothetical protein